MACGNDFLQPEIANNRSRECFQCESDCRHLPLKGRFVEIAVTIELEEPFFLARQALFFLDPGRRICAGLLCRLAHLLTENLLPHFREHQVGEQGAELLGEASGLDLEVATSPAGEASGLCHILVVGMWLSALTAQVQSAKDTTHMPGEFIDAVGLGVSMGGIVVEARASADQLPLLVGKSRLVLAAIALALIDNRASIVTWSEGGIKLIAADGIDRIDGKEPLAKTLAAGAIASGIDGLDNRFSGLTLHA